MGDNMTTIALFGAAGKMGTRIAPVTGGTQYRTMFVELGRMRWRVIQRRPGSDSHLTLPLLKQMRLFWRSDKLIGKVAKEFVPQLKPGAMVICLDPCAACEGLRQRTDITYFVTHPCHHPVVNDEVEADTRLDFFGGIKGQTTRDLCIDARPGRAICAVRRSFGPYLHL
jgi:hypothetical protein